MNSYVRQGEFIVKIGLFGGTFDPVHIGHAVLAERVQSHFALDELVFIPSKLPPHKKTLDTTAKERYEMVLLAAKTLGDSFSVSDYEIKSEGVSYSHRTVKHWREHYPDAALFFITGTDIFLTVATWQNWEDLFNHCNFIVVNRTGTDFAQLLAELPESLTRRVIQANEYNGELLGKVIFFQMEPVDISSTEIRGKLAQEHSHSMLLGDIQDYIENKRLYK
jgi:nicotinate-nucleotide adenylyltransferase